MNFEQMEYIVNVANELSITKAAEKLFISPSGMSQSIVQLEKELGIKIFNRSKAGVTPTFEGRIVISKANKLLNIINELNKELYDYKNDYQNLRILAAPTFFYILEETVLEFNAKNEDVTFKLVERNPREILKNFNKENFDFALIPASKEELNKEKNIRYEHIHKGYVCIAVGQKSPFYSFDYVSPRDLVDSKLIIHEKSDYKPILKLINLHENQVFMISDNNNLFFELIKESQAIMCYLHDFTIVNSPMVKNGDIKIIPLKEENYFYIDFWLIYLESKGLTSIAKKFYNDFLIKFKDWI